MWAGIKMWAEVQVLAGGVAEIVTGVTGGGGFQL